MYCWKCGKEIPGEAAFCKYCGSKVRRPVKTERTADPEIRVQTDQTADSEIKVKAERTADSEIKVQTADTTKSSATSDEVRGDGKSPGTGRKKALIALSALLLLVLITGITVLFLMRRVREEETLYTPEEVVEEVKGRLYELPPEEIDLQAVNMQAGKDNTSAVWDNSLFYMLEDVSPEDTDGRLQHYNVTEMELTNKENGNSITLEIYRHPDSGVVNKIVAIEDQGSQLEITDYYYTDDGTLNFIYLRTDSIYTPTYPTPAKTGERFYYCRDRLLTWRWVDTPNQVEQIILDEANGNTGYMQSLYSDIDSGKQADYDAVELKMLNEAYNVYHAAENMPQIAMIKGYVQDESGTLIKGASIHIYAQSDGYELGEISTDSQGCFRTGISLDPGGYYMEISHDGYETVRVYDLVADRINITCWVENTVLVKKAEENKNNEIRLMVYDAVRDGKNGTPDQNTQWLENAAVTIRRGANCRSGEAVTETQSTADGLAVVSLSPGVYTAQIHLSGYMDNYITLSAGSDLLVKAALVPESGEQEMRIVLTWEGSVDLDSCLFTPLKSENGDMGYINAVAPQDEQGNRLAADSSDGTLAEVICITDASAGTYKYYVTDYSACLNGDLDSTQLRDADVLVQVYYGNKLAVSYKVPGNIRGAVWEVFEVKNGRIIGLQRSYSNIDGKEWWNTDKSIGRRNTEAHRAYYDIIKGGADYTGTSYDTLTTDDIQLINGHKENECFILRDVDNDGIDEFFSVNTRPHPEDPFSFSTALMLDYEDDKMRILFEDSGDASSRTLLLNNNTLAQCYYHGGVVSQDTYGTYVEEDFYFDGELNSYSIREILQDGSLQETVNFSNIFNVFGYGEERYPDVYQVNGAACAEDVWNDCYKVNIGSQLIPQEEWKSDYTLLITQ